MREILFRGKRLDNGEWVEGDFYTDIDDGPVIVGVIHDPGSAYRQPPRDHQIFDKIDPFTLCQFTGLRDKNGERIWEGDRDQWHSHICIISYGNGGFDWQKENDPTDNDLHVLNTVFAEYATRLGSIHDKEQP